MHASITALVSAGMLAISAFTATSAELTAGMQDYDIAGEAGDVIGGAQACGYKLDMVKVETFIETQIANMTGDDRENFRSAVAYRGDGLKEMTEDERVAQCILQNALAKKYGFTD